MNPKSSMKSIFNILNTPSGLSFCGIAKNDFEDFGSIFFINKDSIQAKSAFDNCQKKGKFYTPLEGTNGYSLIPKKYFIVGHSDNFLGWTSNQNETLLFYTKDEIRTDNLNLLRTLIHELTVSYDQKEWLGSYGSVIPPELGISEIQSKDIVFPFIRNIYIRYAFTMARAIHREQILFNDLGLDYSKAFPNRSSLLNMSCQDRVKSLVKLALNFKDHLKVEAKVFEKIESNPFVKIDDPEVLSGMVDILNNYKLSLTEPELGVTYEGLNLCNYLSSGHPYFPIRMNIMGGPDPKTTGGF